MSATNLGREFRDFLFKANVFALALAVVIGNAVGDLVKAVVADLIMPFAGVLRAEGNWRALVLSLGRLNLTVGHLMGAVLDFLIIAAIVFVITRIVMRTGGPPPPPTKPCRECLEQVPVEAKRCKFCTSALTPA